jgi:hypothetical protein
MKIKIPPLFSTRGHGFSWRAARRTRLARSAHWYRERTREVRCERAFFHNRMSKTNPTPECAADLPKCYVLRPDAPVCTGDGRVTKRTQTSDAERLLKARAEQLGSEL